jgi:hypothetical protein
MSDFGTMIDQINRDLRRDGITADVKDAIHRSIKFFEGDRFWFNEGEASANTSTGVALYTLPPDFREADSFKITVDSAGNSYTLIGRTFQYIDQVDINPNSNWGTPTEYATYRDQLRLFPVPDKGYTLNLAYQKDLLEVSASSSTAATNSWMTEGANLIRAKAMAYLFRYRLRNFGAAQEMDKEALIERARLKQKTNRQVSTGFFRKTSF